MDGLVPKDVSLFSYNDIANLKRSGAKFEWRIDTDQGFGFFTELTLTGDQGGDVAFTATIQNTGQPNAGNIPSGYSISWTAIRLYTRQLQRRTIQD